MRGFYVQSSWQILESSWLNCESSWQVVLTSWQVYKNFLANTMKSTWLLLGGLLLTYRTVYCVLCTVYCVLCTVVLYMKPPTK